MTKKILFTVFIFIIFSCDEGLSPEMAEISPGFGGTVTFIGNWDNKVTRTHVVLFRNPLLSKKDFNAFNLKFVSDSIATGTQSYNYSTYDDNSLLSNIQSGEYAYLAVAQSKTEELSLNREDWIIVGLYSFTDGDSIKPKTLIIPEASFIDSTNIVCDFNNPPPQPPGGNTETIIRKLLKTLKSK
jgi:hypothetical protein